MKPLAEAGSIQQEKGVLPFVDHIMQLQRWLSELIIVAMVLLIVAEVVCRSFLGFSLMFGEELAGYLLVALVFLGMGASLHAGALFRVEFLIGSLSERGRNALQLVFDLLSLAFAVLLAWQMFALASGSYARHIEAATILATPLYIPQIVMVVGSCTLVLVLLSQCLARVLAIFRRAA